MKSILVILSILITSSIFSQGCSDAGFCSLINTTPLSERSGKKVHTVRLSQSIGRADKTLMAYNTAIEYSRWICPILTVNARVNFLAHSGNDIETGEIGDAYLTADYKISQKITSIIGFKIPLRYGDKVKKGIVLPMDYQPSLGTLDFLFGLQTKCENWGFGLGFQQPLTQNNNHFFSQNFIATEVFQTTNNYFRNPDAWARLSYFLHAGKFTIIPNLLPIYHLGDDSYVEGGNRMLIKGSKGLTLNGDIQIDFNVCESNTIGFNFAAPLVVRDARPDGLTRKYNATLDFRHRF